MTSSPAAAPGLTGSGVAARVEAVTPTALLAHVRDSRRQAAAHEVEVLRLAVEWAHAHPDPDAQRCAVPGPLDPAESAYGGAEPEVAEWAGVPAMAWDAAAPFAAANAMSTAAGRAYLRDALVLVHRLPRLHSRVLAGDVPVWQARRVAQRTLGRPDDVCAHLDLALAQRAGGVGAAVVDRLLDEAMIQLHPEQREADQLEALDRRHATLHAEGISHTGLVDMTITADWPDLDDFDHALDEVADALAARDASDPETDPRDDHDTRRARAVGVLADPAAALALLRPGGTDTERDPATTTARRRRSVELVVHLSDLALLGLDPGACTEGPGGPRRRATLDATVRAWCARPEVQLAVRPVLDLAAPIGHGGYQPTATQRDHVVHRDQTCVFPRCDQPARTCDLDHIEPWATGGPTHTDNLAALCRHHHRLKTLAGWSYERLGPSTYLWTDPHGQLLLRTREATRDLTPTQAPG